MNARGKTVGIVQARFRSERLPGKVMRDIAGKPALHHVLTRLARATRLDEIWLACVDDAADDPLAELASGLGIAVARGSEADVIARFGQAVAASGAGAVVRITADCPMVDPAVVDLVVERFHGCDADFVSNTLTRSFPDGLDVEVFTRAAFDRADREARDPFLRAHVTPYIHGRLKDRLPWGGFSNEQVVHPADFSHLRWTLDEAEDLLFLDRVFRLLPEGFGWQDVIALLTRRPELGLINSGHVVYEGTRRDLAKRDGSNLPRRYDASNQWFERATRTIPLGSQTFSKSYQQWVKGAAPLFITEGRGCRVTDPDGNRYIDYLLGLLPVVLGYRDPEVDDAIVAQLQQGITFSLAHPSEAILAETLVELIPCAEMVRFGKNGSDVTAAAIRIARAHTGRDRVIVAGYHGWHDWYIGTTTRDLGVPEAVKALSSTVPFNDAAALRRLLESDPTGFAALILEPDGAYAPAPGYLEEIRALTAHYGVVLVFDEIITGFRMALGGAQEVHGVTPDLGCFGKAMANGMPISAIVGRAEIMARMEDIFFSTTFGGEALSIAAAIATIDKLRREDVIPRLWRRGEELRDGANRVIAAHGLGEAMAFAGAGWWPRLKLKAPPIEPWLFTSLWRQELNANGLILGASFNLCLAHDDDAITAETLAGIGQAAASLRAMLDGPDPAAHLRGAPVQPTFTIR